MIRTISRFLLLACAMASLLAPPIAGAQSAEEPKPDPAGLATGDKTAVVDGAGNAFVIAAPTDKTAPDYTKSMKDYQDFQAQSAREPLTLKLADAVGATLCALWAFGATFAVFAVVNKIKSMRVDAEVEAEGLDVPEFGLHCYPEDAVGAES